MGYTRAKAPTNSCNWNLTSPQKFKNLWSLRIIQLGPRRGGNNTIRTMLIGTCRARGTQERKGPKYLSRGCFRWKSSKRTCRCLWTIFLARLKSRYNTKGWCKSNSHLSKLRMMTGSRGWLHSLLRVRPRLQLIRLIKMHRVTVNESIWLRRAHHWGLCWQGIASGILKTIRPVRRLSKFRGLSYSSLPSTRGT